jgi:hypothetical protein
VERGRGKQGNILICTRSFCQRSMSGPVSLHAQERGMTVRLPYPQRCSPRPRKRGALHGLRLLAPLLPITAGRTLPPPTRWV